MKTMRVSLLAAWLLSVFTSTAEAGVPVYSTESAGTYFRQWLLCGPMELGEHLSRNDYKHGRQCTGFLGDLLESAGGEGAARPRAGDEVLSKGKRYSWFRYDSTSDLIPLDEIFTPNDLVVAYAFCRIRAARAGRHILAVGSNDGLKVWLNGKNVHTHHPEDGRWLQADDDFVPVQLREGLNDLLIKVDEGSGDFGFAVRLLDYEQTVVAVRKELNRHKRLSVVTEADVARVHFGEPYAISVLRPAGKVAVELLDGVGKRLAVRSARPGHEINFPLAAVADGPLTFRASFPVDDGETLTSECAHFKGKLPRHPTVRNLRDLATLDDTGKPYLPLGMYGVPRSAYGKVKEAGLNFVMGSAADLGVAHAAGLKVAVGLHGSGAGWIDHIKETVAAVQSHPALLCWMVFDEPGYNKANLLEIHTAYNTLYELDKIHPSYLVITQSGVYETFGRCCDVLAVDTYPVSRGDYSAVAGAVERAYEVSDGDQPVWHCGQLFAWPKDRPPTPHEHRYMTFTTLIAGAKAFLWYAYGHRGWTLPDDDPGLWKAHLRLLKELQDLSSVILAPGRGEKAEVEGGRGRIRAVIKSDGYRIFLFAASDARKETVECTFLLPPGSDSEIKVYGEDRNVTARTGRLTDTFQPLDVHVYHIASKKRR